MYNLEQIKEQKNIGGGWAIRVYYEELIARWIAKESINFINPLFFYKKSSGLSALNTYQKISQIFNKDFGVIPSKIGDNVIIKLPIITNISDLPDLLQVEFWVDELKKELDATDKTLTRIITDLHKRDKFTRINSKEILYKWSFPILESFYKPRKKLNYPDIEFLETEIALKCWRRWYWTNNFKNIFLISPSKRYGFGNNQIITKPAILYLLRILR